MSTELMRIRQKHKLTSTRVAVAAQVPLRVEYLCEIGGWVEQEEAQKVVEALSHLTGEVYSLEMFAFNITTKEGTAHDPDMR